MAFRQLFDIRHYDNSTTLFHLAEQRRLGELEGDVIEGPRKRTERDRQAKNKRKLVFSSVSTAPCITVCSMSGNNGGRKRLLSRKTA